MVSGIGLGVLWCQGSGLISASFSVFLCGYNMAYASSSITSSHNRAQSNLGWNDVRLEVFLSCSLFIRETFPQHSPTNSSRIHSPEMCLYVYLPEIKGSLDNTWTKSGCWGVKGNCFCVGNRLFLLCGVIRKLKVTESEKYVQDVQLVTGKKWIETRPL